MIIFKCEICSKESKSYIKNPRFCSRECWHKHQNSKDYVRRAKVKKCYICKKEFSNKANTKFCSKECYNKYLIEQNPLKKELKNVVCKNCKKGFNVKNYSHAEYCSRSCYWDFYKTNGLFKTNGENNITRVWKKCKNCKNDFWLHKYRSNDGVFCSKECHDKFRRKNIKCPSCKKIFTSPQYENRKYCSVECSCKGLGKRKSKLHLSVCAFIKRLQKRGELNRIEQEKMVSVENRRLSPDFIINDSIIVECYGDYWHCNPKVYSEKYYHSKIQKTAKEIWDNDITRENLLKKNYRVIIIWEKEWNENKRVVFKKIGAKINEFLKS